MSKIIIFGIHDFSELAHYYLQYDSPHQVVAFSVSRNFMPEDTTFLMLPVVPFDEVENLYPPSECLFFAPMSPKSMNRDREVIYHAIKAKGYSCISYISSKATLFDNEIGENCFILESNTIQPFTKIGNNVVLWSGNHIGHHSVIYDHVTLTSHVVISGHCEIGSYSFFGVNSTLRDGLRVAEGSFIAMAAAVFQDTDPWSVYRGNPARKLAISSLKVKL